MVWACCHVKKMGKIAGPIYGNRTQRSDRQTCLTMWPKPRCLSSSSGRLRGMVPQRGGSVSGSDGVFRIGTVRYNWPMSALASQAFSIVHCTDSEDTIFRLLMRHSSSMYRRVTKLHSHYVEYQYKYIYI